MGSTDGKCLDCNLKLYLTKHRGECMNHVTIQKHIRIKANGAVEQIYKKI